MSPESGQKPVRPVATAVIVAAGSGARLGAGGPKALVEIAGRPMYEWSLIACEDAERIDRVVIAVPPGEGDAFPNDRATLVEGGATRSESVALALEEVAGDLVAIHDAARPMVTSELFDATVSALAGSPELDGVLAAAPVTDTVKVVDTDGVVSATLERSTLRAAQTPQVFRTGSLRAALAADDAGQATDDASLVEAAGGRVAVIEMPGPNPKVTWPTDVDLVEALLERARGRVPEWKVSGC